MPVIQMQHANGGRDSVRCTIAPWPNSRWNEPCGANLMLWRCRFVCHRAFRPRGWIAWLGAVLFFPAPSLIGQTAACPVPPLRPATEADKAYEKGRYAGAEHLYAQAFAQRPQDGELAAALVYTLLHEGAVAKAASLVNEILPKNPDSAITLAALAAVQLAQGQPWLALRT